MIVNDVGLKQIMNFEGVKLKAYLDGGGVPTIGVGTIVYPSGIKVKLGDVCTLSQALFFLKYDVEKREEYLNKILKVPLTQNQYNMCISLMYNIGNEAFKNSTVLKRINAKADRKEITKWWIVWNKDNGNFVQGLANRRLKEIEIYFL